MTKDRKSNDPVSIDLSEAWHAADRLDAPLNERLALYAKSARMLRPDLTAALDRFVDGLSLANAGFDALKAGDDMPDFLLPDQESRLISLAALLETGPLVVSFNRGHWCPYCRLELSALGRVEPELFAAGARIVSIVPDRAEHSIKLFEVLNLPFAVLTDIDLEFTRQMGLAIKVSPEVQKFYLASGIDLPWFHGSQGWCLPIPATVVVGQEGIIRAAYIDPDFRRRMPLSDISDIVARS